MDETQHIKVEKLEEDKYRITTTLTQTEVRNKAHVISIIKANRDAIDSYKKAISQTETYLKDLEEIEGKL